jgi:very-short-patch-repair endonuclease
VPGFSTTKLAKQLRKDSTDAEKLLWSRLRAKSLVGVKFRRQEPFRNYILDFVSYEKRIVIELDGGQHAESKEKDGMRDALLNEEGFTVL